VESPYPWDDKGDGRSEPSTPMERPILVTSTVAAFGYLNRYLEIWYAFPFVSNFFHFFGLLGRALFFEHPLFFSNSPFGYPLLDGRALFGYP
jgi:hypothetical protein